ncbi:sialidase family protein [Leifsonia sp. Leaf264]|uniref:sialidase family protein n=1 Tax=Leifsonia sp. Leaf264 TaxID=1736314 RepID=UPI0006F4B613|nr:sialidase family protein [Leifsonia sp. Leaf264]KQO98625.1 hypothetical protein ASF30_11220 [Leifsonia sp. Leaf264]
MLRLRHAITASRAAIDLASIMVGVIVIAIVSGIIGVSVFAVIPWAHEQAAKSNLQSVVLAEQTARVPSAVCEKSGRYLSRSDLNECHFLDAPDNVTVGAPADGSCYLGIATTGNKVFWVDNKTPTIHDAKTEPGTNDCVNFAELLAELAPAQAPEPVPVADPFTVLTKYDHRTPISSKWAAVDMSTDGAVMVAALTDGALYRSTDVGQTWDPMTAAGQLAWSSIAVSPNGDHIIASVTGGDLWTSDDNGKHWKALGVGTQDWTDVQVSSDGKTVIGTARGQNIFHSEDAGSTWTTTPTGEFTAVATSKDGAHLAAAVKDGPLYTSADSGKHWAVRTAAGQLTWSGLTSSQDGDMLVASVANGFLYRSTDYGKTWTPLLSDSARNWSSVSSSYNGQKIVATVSGGTVWHSTDGGANWVQRTNPTGTITWSSSAYAGNGSMFIVGNLTGNPYTSVDGGATFTKQTAGGSLINAVAANKDGSRIAASRSGSSAAVYSSSNGGTNWVTSSNSPAASSIAIDPDGTTILAGRATFAEYYLAVSTNGTTFTDQTQERKRDWGPIALADGGKMIAGVSGATGQIILSSNSGTTLRSVGSDPASWEDVDMSDDGVHAVAGQNTGTFGAATTDDGGFTWRAATSPATAEAVAISTDGQRVLASRNSGNYAYVYLSTDGGVTFSQTGSQAHVPTVACDKDCKAMYSPKIFNATQGYDLYRSPDGGATWPSVGNLLNNESLYQSIAMSKGDEGKIAVMATAGTVGQVFVSTDSGTTWRTTNLRAGGWTAVSASDDGSHLVAGISTSSQYLYESNDAGQTWSQRTTSSDITTAAISGDGKKILVRANTSYRRVDADGGAWTAMTGGGGTAKVAALNRDGSIAYTGSWFSATTGYGLYRGNTTAMTTTGVTNSLWTGLDTSSDGKLVLAPVKTGQIFRTVDGTATTPVWTPVGPTATWKGATIASGDSTIAYAVADNRKVVKSTDSGATWSDKESGEHPFVGVATSSDGSKVVAAASDGHIHTSVNGGTAWHDWDAPGAWQSVAMSGDGAHIYLQSADGVVRYDFNQG